LPRTTLPRLSAKRAAFTGVVRNALWEGLGGHERIIFERNMKLEIADNALLVVLGDDKGSKPKFE
jgi:hypothetical protein